MIPGTKWKQISSGSISIEMEKTESSHSKQFSIMEHML